ncbi:MAG: V-type ATP synthase subunit F [Steroidobacteraceae bacterium]
MDLTVVADELTALGWRLAGARVLLADARNVADALRTALDGADLVLITADLAGAVPSAHLQDALCAYPPLLLVIADLRRGREPADIEEETKRALGVAV